MGRKGGGKGDACFIGTESGHIARDCPQGSSGKGAGKGKGPTLPPPVGAAAGRAARAAEAGGADVTPSVVASLLRTGPASEEAERAEAARREGGPKGQRARLAWETLQILEAGGYRPPGPGGWVDLGDSVRAAVAASTHHPAASWRPAADLPPRSGRATELEVQRRFVLEVAENLAGVGDGRTGVLNFASARNPGGGFTTGAQAQEESIARSSALYPCLMRHFNAFFVPNRHARSGAYTHDFIYSPAVPVLRDNGGVLLPRPYLADFVTAAAPNRGVMRGGDAAREAEEALQERALRVLDAFASRAVTDIVLGAWGCGVFRNDPRAVAEAFAAHLGGEFRGRFRRVIFAVPDAEMAAIFEAALDRIREVHPAAAEPAASELSSDEKQALKLAKRLREIRALEAAGGNLQKNQQEKVAGKERAAAELFDVLSKLPPASATLAKVQDVKDYIGGGAAPRCE